MFKGRLSTRTGDRPVITKNWIRHLPLSCKFEAIFRSDMVRSTGMSLCRALTCQQSLTFLHRATCCQDTTVGG